MIRAIRHTAIMVEDMERALTFYRDLLGFKVIRDAIEEGNHIDRILGSGISFREVKLSTTDSLKDGTVIELIQTSSLPDDFSHIALRVDDIEKEYRRLLKAGIKFSCPPIVSPDGYAKITCCLDPSGYVIELVEIL